MHGRKRVVITGTGAITSLGREKKELWSALCNGESGIKPITSFDTTAFEVKFGGEVSDFNPAEWLDTKEARRLDRFSQFAIAATDIAVTDAGLNFDAIDTARVGVFIGSGMGGLLEFEAQHKNLLNKGPSRVSPFMVPKLMANAASAHAAIRYGLRGPNFAVVAACTTGVISIGEAVRVIQRGDADIMITGSSEAVITPLAVAGFGAMKALSTHNSEPQKASRPFDKNRDGFVISEGAGIVVIEELEAAKKRGATIYAEILGYGMTADAYHIAAPNSNGEGAIRCMTHALNDAGCGVETIDYINAHATSTPLGDQIEVGAIKKVFGDHASKIPVSSTKSMLGHQLGASGSVEIIICAFALNEGVIPPTINYETPDPQCSGLDFVPNEAREKKIHKTLSNSFGFGGHNATIILGKV
ncbi:3-oxoacyl-[acyl-carrier-protein] synthase II [Candidatus Kuenenia stuttgartiensis]|jgi:3-oxoacyl-[acyl-carrier-protein] synthase II|uniref:3-oxoacyl-[acyl-carrier-protein] synthase 2 n=1 Tax=Kuenenia stuttgartiensis TaxID=174633 RepID=Q1PYH6_KUEST|nr:MULTISPECIES: beta-ketoacyl-ACP synthase II [Kuenenia]MBE7547569.1 beta-ketoacyl-ACP synthase II [Planctomycetia bacterium]MBW7941067.1 beta-ketoacyl-ACP synthase II [Candidatus Kuenenia stuttgartiensis]MBZ0193283.1 beta-ketoacyl-ACP synthase II [Candidatus Kuenenia stuttgartiensis]MCF6152119.1 beta-ketoacyl-[acyl-carrier-protein] synthase II [Candidatus Kuenenia stuttgartiensis]MCL4727703.1 beta-ketoacyl-ACP synthase II [Candidatus Kuenenia stuttgartiensis]